MPLTTDLEHDELLWLLESLCGLFRLPFDRRLAARACPPPCTLATLVEAAHRIGLTTTRQPLPRHGWPDIDLPVIAFAGDGDDRFPVIVVRREGTRLLAFRAGSEAPWVLSTDEAATRLAATVISVSGPTVTNHASAGDDGIGPAVNATSEGRFGFRWFVPELLRHRRIWRDVLVASLALQGVALATPLFTQAIIDKVIVHQTQSTLAVFASALALFAVFTAGMSWLRQYLVLHTGNRIDAVLGSAVFQHLLRLPLPYFEQRSTGALVARLHGVETIREFLTSAAVMLVLDLPFLLLFLGAMFVYSWQLSLISVGLVALMAVCGIVTTPIFRARLDRQFLLGARSQSFVTEYLAGIGTVKALQLEPDLARRYDEMLARYLNAGFATRQAANTYQVATSGLEQLMTLGILVAGALLVMRNDGFTIGMLIAFQMFASRVSQPMLRLAGLWQEFQQADLAVRRLGDIMDMPQERSAALPRRVGSDGAAPARIEIEDLGFRYDERTAWLYRGLSLRFRPGHLTVVTGASGCGKSTLAKLLLGFCTASEGRLLLDGIDVRQLAPDELRGSFGVVPQDTVLFSGTIYDNVVMGQPHASFEDVVAACRAAEIHQVIEQLPDGYQTAIGERGTGLSGGQRQRIAIARALLKRPRILLFDEAVANLDPPTADQFAKTINTLKGSVTIIFITHQVPRTLQVDEVFTLGTRTVAPRMEIVRNQDAGGK